MDPDPYSAVMDALGEQDYDEIVISTHPETRSGWLRQGLVDRVQRAARRPVEHVVVDLDAERNDVKRTLVVANQTVSSRPLLEALKRKADEEPRRFIVIAPQADSEEAEGDPHDRLASTLKELTDAGLPAVGQVEHHDPYTAIQNALQFYAPDDIVISTLPGDALGLAARRPDRTRGDQHRQARRARRERGGLMEAATAHAEHHHGPPAANVSSRVEAQFLGMLLFIISEIMLFGAFFTAYFFIRVVAGGDWFPINEVDLPKAIAGVNTAILISSSFTMHWALEGARNENRNALRWGCSPPRCWASRS